MKPGTRMLMATIAGDGRSDRMMPRTYDRREETRMGYSEPYGGYYGAYEPESRFRDRSGREHYDNGRFAPMRNEYIPDGISHEMQPRRRYETRADEVGMSYPYVPPVYERRAGNVISMNQIGFSAEDHQRHGGAHSEHKLTREMAEEWMKGLHNEDGTTGPYWTKEQTTQVMERLGFKCDPTEFWVAMNSIYSDYAKVAKKHNMNNVDFYADMAKAWLDDTDAVHDKAAAYFMYITK